MMTGQAKERTRRAIAFTASAQCSHESLVMTTSGYERHLDYGRRETFDEHGRLIQIGDGSGNYIQLSYEIELEPVETIPPRTGTRSSRPAIRVPRCDLRP
jgi:hypothetical protein